MDRLNRYRLRDGLEIRDADLLLFRRRSLISIVGRSIYSHAAMVAWWGCRPFCLEVREGYGGRAVTLESQIEARPGQIDLYWIHAAADLDRERAVETMRGLCGSPYGWESLAKVALLHLPVVRWFLPPVVGDDGNGHGRPMFCSQAVSHALRAGGLDPVPNLPDRYTEPADLARSSAFTYACTLVP